MESEGPTYDPAHPYGGDARLEDVQAQYVGYEFHYLFIIVASFLVWMIIPGISLLYSGLTRRKSSLVMIFQSFMVLGVVTFQWMFWGYSLTYSRTGGSFIGNMDNIGLRNTWMAPQGDIPEIAFCLYQLLFAAVTVQILIGGSFERGRVLPSLLFAFCWVTIVYCPVAYWTWNANGWLAILGDLDYAGGGPVHIASGCSALAYALILGKRKHTGEPHHGKPHNTTLVFLGTVLIWFGWFGFNGGSTLNLSVRSLVACFNTNTAASFGVIGFTLVDYIRHKRRFSVVGACEGAIAGLVGITPAAGFVHPWLAAVIGFITAVVCALLENMGDWIGIDEGLDVFKLHGVGGMVGSFLTGIFATSAVSMVDGNESSGGIDGNGIQIGYNLAAICATASYSFVISVILLLILKYIPGVGLRVSEEQELRGLDQDQFVDEQIGDWRVLDDIKHSRPHSLSGGALTHGIAQEGESSGSDSAPVVEQEKERAARA